MTQDNEIKDFKVVLDVAEKLGIDKLETKDIANELAEILSKTLNKKVNIDGDGLSSDMNVIIEK
jgi:predicted DsbA family dithiol-disulfide isomerase